MRDGSHVPVLLIAFNRPDLTSIALDRLRQIRPRRVYLAVDGPRPGTPGDERLVTEVRRRLESGIDWPSDVVSRFAERNQGCMLGVSNAIDWFFRHVDQGIILEDDCLPDPSFFPYAAELLERYAADDDVMHIGGTNPLPPGLRPHSYYFSKYNHIWGWATWRRAWQHYDVSLADWPDVKARRTHHAFFPDDTERRMWERRWDAVRAGESRDNWDYQWFFARLLRGMAIVPAVNLVSNIGFRRDATHTRNTGDEEAALPCLTMRQPLVHPAGKEIDTELDTRYFERHVYPDARKYRLHDSPEAT
ncbi:hypothetical protein [Kitasatospora viridis]|uniref:Hemolytic protein HlpA-like protein n=1 Tax=Kitasatospora viridis TaxID=281105 RepID=A0A561SDX6_9ACTN|nr:hypothetical protein [Kitasatospora viridis]TWF73048.1 hypothetical protein FHX73_16199 [Kitasatospora viridis]